MSVTRQALLASWHAAQKAADKGESGSPIVLSHAAAAGWLLEQHGSVRAAHAHVPLGFGWWDPVRTYLRALMVAA